MTGGVFGDASDRRVAEVVAANARYYAAFEAGDLDGMALAWVDGPAAGDAWCVHPGMPPIRGRDRVLRSYAAAMAQTSFISFVITELQVTVEHDLAVVTCIENVLSDAGARGGLSGGTVVATNVLRRAAGEWRVLGHHASAVASS